MRFDLPRVARSVDDTDLSDITRAKRTGPAFWNDDGTLEIPFDRTLTAEEADAVATRLTSPDTAAEQARKQLTAYLETPNPTSAQNEQALRVLCRVVLALMDRNQ